MKYLLCFVCLTLVVRLSSQPPTYNLCKYFGANYPENSKYDWGYALFKYQNKFHILNYQRDRNNVNERSTALYVTDSLGNKVWDKHYHKQNGDMLRTKNYVIDSLMYILSRIDKVELTTRDSVQLNIINLNTKEIKNIQNPLSEKNTFLGGIGLLKAENNTLMLIEATSIGKWDLFNLPSDYRVGFIFTKIDKEGKKIWTQEIFNWNSIYFDLIGACSDEEGNIYILNEIQDRNWWMGPQNLDEYYPRIELFKIDKNGNSVFNKTIQKGDFDAFYENISEDSDVAYHNGQILISHSGNMTDEGSMVYACNKEGELIWRYSEKLNTFGNTKLVNAKEGFLVVTEGFNEKNGWYKGRIAKFDFKGNKVWDRTYMDSTRFVWLKIEDAIELEDGRIAVSGTVSTNTGIGTSILLMTLNSDGCYESNCQETDIWHLPETTPVSIQEVVKKQIDYHIKISPNPATDRLTIEVTLPHYDEKTELLLCDLTGKELIKTRLPDYAYIGYMNVGQLSAGMYILQLRQRSRILKSEKVVVE